MSQFAFLQRARPAVPEAAGRAERAVHADPHAPPASMHAAHSNSR